MSRKDYEAIAASMKQAKGYCETEEQRRGVERAILCLVPVLASDNPAFDRRRFLAASGAAATA